jgi:hypothetical protein
MNWIMKGIRIVYLICFLQQLDFSGSNYTFISWDPRWLSLQVSRSITLPFLSVLWSVKILVSRRMGRLFKKTNKGDTRLPLQDDEIWAEKSTSDQYLNSVSSTRGRRWIELFLLLLPRRTKGLSLMIGSLQHIYLNPCE